jgi:hypothetical protein
MVGTAVEQKQPATLLFLSSDLWTLLDDLLGVGASCPLLSIPFLVRSTPQSYSNSLWPSVVLRFAMKVGLDHQRSNAINAISCEPPCLTPQKVLILLDKRAVVII